MTSGTAPTPHLTSASKKSSQLNRPLRKMPPNVNASVCRKRIRYRRVESMTAVLEPRDAVEEVRFGLGPSAAPWAPRARPAPPSSRSSAGATATSAPASSTQPADAVEDDDAARPERLGVERQLDLAPLEPGQPLDDPPRVGEVGLLERAPQVDDETVAPFSETATSRAPGSPSRPLPFCHRAGFLLDPDVSVENRGGKRSSSRRPARRPGPP